MDRRSVRWRRPRCGRCPGVVQDKRAARKGLAVEVAAEQDHEDEDLHLINNRQNGRRRGRGGGPRSPNQSPNMGNRQDNRSRGNAAQLLEKYKALARDAQLQGDRVQSEYWLQFAEHYYRVLNENRARFEEQPRGREDYGSDEDEDQDEGMQADDGDERDERPLRDERPERQLRSDRPDRPREDRPERQGRDERPERQPRDDRGDRFEGRERPRREYRDDRNGERRPEGFRPRRDREAPRGEAEADNQNDERISLEVLPPAIAVVEGDAPPKPRRRPRRPAGDEGEDIAPAA